MSLEIIRLRRRNAFFRLYLEALSQARRVSYAAWISDVLGHRTRVARFHRLWWQTCRQLRGIDRRARRAAREGLL